MKACCIYKTKNEFKIVTQSFTDTGLFMDDEPISILPIDIDISLLGDIIFNALNSGKKDLVFPQTREEMSQRQKNILKLLKEKSYSSLYKNSKNCSLRLENDVLKIYPSKFSYEYKGLVTVHEDTVEIDYHNCDKIDVIKELLKLLNNDY